MPLELTSPNIHYDAQSECIGLFTHESGGRTDAVGRGRQMREIPSRLRNILSVESLTEEIFNFALILTFAIHLRLHYLEIIMFRIFANVQSFFLSKFLSAIRCRVVSGRWILRSVQFNDGEVGLISFSDISPVLSPRRTKLFTNLYEFTFEKTFECKSFVQVLGRHEYPLYLSENGNSPVSECKSKGNLKYATFSLGPGIIEAFQHE